jgi:hypothetical protein
MFRKLKQPVICKNKRDSSICMVKGSEKRTGMNISRVFLRDPDMFERNPGAVRVQQVPIRPDARINLE